MPDVTVIIGPNGYGKTTFLNNERQRLIDSGVPESGILFMESEIKLLDEMKDTVDTSQAMEYVISELISTPSYLDLRDKLFEEADAAIAASVGDVNALVDDVLALNGQTRSKDAISPNPKRFVKNIVSIEQSDIKKKMGSGQRMQLLLALVGKSNKQYIFLDEPEKYSHPSLLNGTARLINELVAAGKTVFIATHSPKLISMLDIDYDAIRLINDGSHRAKPLPFDEAVAKASKLVNVGAMEQRFRRYYDSGSSLSVVLRRRHGRYFVESLFTKRVYLCEGANDELFVNEALHQFGGAYDDYCIVKTWGKTNLPVFMELYRLLGIEVVVCFDVDDESNSMHRKTNEAIRSLAGKDVVLIEFEPCLEKAFEFKGKKSDAMAFIEHVESEGISEDSWPWAPSVGSASA